MLVLHLIITVCHVRLLQKKGQVLPHTITPSTLWGTKSNTDYHKKKKKVILINNIRKQNPGMQSPELFKMRFCQRRRDDSSPTTVNAMS